MAISNIPVDFSSCLSREMVADPPCLKDGYTLALQRQHAELTGPEFQSCLRLQAHLQMVDIAGIEARHASVRRQVTARSVQTWRLSLAQASSEWLLQNIRAGSQRVSKDKKRKVPWGLCEQMWAGSQVIPGPPRSVPETKEQQICFLSPSPRKLQRERESGAELQEPTSSAFQE